MNGNPMNLPPVSIAAAALSRPSTLVIAPSTELM